LASDNRWLNPIEDQVIPGDPNCPTHDDNSVHEKRGVQLILYLAQNVKGDTIEWEFQQATAKGHTLNVFGQMYGILNIDHL
jgi:hypothetical protein